LCEVPSENLTYVNVKARNEGPCIKEEEEEEFESFPH
jgi:hypothetical protein